jgi:hypothetical protein
LSLERREAADERDVEHLIELVGLVQVERTLEVRGDVLHVGRVLGG